MRHWSWHSKRYRVERLIRTKLSLIATDDERLADPSLTSEDASQIEAEIERKAQSRLKSNVCMWRPVEYDEITAWAYLLAKAPFDYATVATIMQEIKERDPVYQPRTLFDFGSGVGTAIWYVRFRFLNLGFTRH
jgi:ribosomal protein RSM22 (predicted rRNA methylase)